jgi:hypothetical protein
MRDFEQVVGDARRWLRTVPARPTVRNEVLNFGWVRRCWSILSDPLEVVAVVESRRYFNAGRNTGALTLSSAVNTPQESLLLRWDSEQGMSVMSPLTYYPDQLVPLVNLTGPILDRVYERVAPAMEAVLRQIIETGQ